MNKRGNLFDGFSIIFTVFAAAVICLVLVILFSKINAAFTTDSTLSSTAGAGIISNVDANFGWVADFFLVMLFLSLPIASMILAFFNNIHPLFFWASLGVTMLLVIVGANFASGWVSFGQDSTLGAGVSALPMTNLILSNYGVYSFLIVLIISAGVYVKTRDAGGFG